MSIKAREYSRTTGHFHQYAGSKPSALKSTANLKRVRYTENNLWIKPKGELN